MTPTDEFKSARDLLLDCRSDYAQARARFQWPALGRFNWALDWLDQLALTAGERPALLAPGAGSADTVTFAQLSERSDLIAGWWHRAGVRAGDRMLVAMDNSAAIWESLVAAIKLGAVVIPTSPQLGAREIADRVRRAGVRHIACDAPTAARLDLLSGELTRLLIDGADGDRPSGWQRLAGDPALVGGAEFPRAATALTDPLLAYFTSGTTSRPKLVRHTHGYPVGHLSTMYWIGLQPGDVHLNVAAPGWAKHLGSGLFAAWNAEATVVVHRMRRFSAAELLEVIEQLGVTTLCAPPPAWRMLVREDLAGRSLRLRELVSAGEPLDAAVIRHVQRELGLTIRDGYGQTETTHLIGNSPGQPVRPGSIGRPMPGIDVHLRSEDGPPSAAFGELVVAATPGRIGIMAGYGVGGVDGARARGDHPTGDLVHCDEDGYLTYVGRVDEVFKASGYRVSPLEVERILLEHPAVAEVAVVPAPDPTRGFVPKAYVSPTPGWQPDGDTAESILLHARATLAPYMRVRRVTFCDLPKTISGKVRRAELRQRELSPHHEADPAGREWRDDDVRASAVPVAGFPSLGGSGS